MPGRIVVGWDGSTASRAAVGWAVGHLDGSSGPLSVVHAVPADAAEQSLSDVDASVRSAVSTWLGPDPALEVDVEVHRGGPVAVLLASVDERSVLVVGRDRPRLGRDGRPSAADRLVDAAPCTVVVVADATPALRDGVVVAVDPGGSARRPLLFAAQEARRAGQAVVAVSAWSPTDGDDVDGRPDREHARRLRILEEQVEDAFAGAPDIDVLPTVVVGPPARPLVEAAADSSLLVVGAGRRPGHAGPVAERVARVSTTPVAVVR